MLSASCTSAWISSGTFREAPSLLRIVAACIFSFFARKSELCGLGIEPLSFHCGTSDQLD
jgi:hypothetical protein